MKLAHLINYSFVILLLLTGCNNNVTNEAVKVAKPLGESPPKEEEEIQPVQGLTIPARISIDQLTELEPGSSSLSKLVVEQSKESDSQIPFTSKTSLTSAQKPLPATKSFDAPGTDYSRDSTRSFFWSESLSKLDTINALLCMIQQIATKELVNKIYIAKINLSRCNRFQYSDGDNVANEKADTWYELWTVDSRREDSSSPQKIRIWHSENATFKSDLLMEVTIRQSPETESPLGDFTLTWKASNELNSAPHSTVNATIQTGLSNNKQHFEYVLLNDRFASNLVIINSARVELEESDQTKGSGKTLSREITPRSESQSEYLLTYNKSYLLHQKNDNSDRVYSPYCYNRDFTDEHVWSYNLYHEADGSRVRHKALDFIYTHTSDNDRNWYPVRDNPYIDEDFNLSYINRMLTGIPLITNENDMEVPAFSLKSGTLLTDQTRNYVVKANTSSKHLRLTDLNNCINPPAALSFTKAQSISLLTAEDIPPVNFHQTDKPEIDEPPSVIDGNIITP